jgi:hypothetical protein
MFCCEQKDLWNSVDRIKKAKQMMNFGKNIPVEI